MAIVKMKKLRLLAMRADMAELLHSLQLLGCVELSEQETDAPEWEGLVRRDETHLTEKRALVSRLSAALRTLDQYAHTKTGLFAQPVQVGVDELFDEALPQRAMQMVETLEEAQTRLTSLYALQSRLENEQKALQLWLPLDVPLEAESTPHVLLRFGTLPAQCDLDALRAELSAQSANWELLEAGRDSEQIGVLLVCYARDGEAVTQIMRAHAFSQVSWPEYKGTARENADAIARRLEQARGEIAATTKELSGCGAYRDTIRLYFERAKQDLAGEEAREKLLDTESAFSLQGWMPAEEEARVTALLGRYDCAWELSEPAPEEYPQVPIKLKNNKLTRALNMVTEMYSLPAYDGVDPNPLMAPFFILFYGIMMADMGYGLLMVLAGIIVKVKAKPRGGMRNFFELLILCGVSTFVMGALTGGFFGDAPLQIARIINPDTTWTGLPSLFNPLNDTVMILLGSMALGLVHILTGMAISFVEKLKAGKILDAVWEELTWWIVFAGIALMALGVGNVGGVPVVLCLGALMVVVGSGWHAKGFGKVTAVFASLYNNVTGYFGDILSYSRLMALMLAGSVIAQVFNTIGAIAGNLVVFLLVSLVGNALNFALNLLGCYVHDLRLQCLEFFKKFYKDGGKPFRPLEVNTKYVRVVNK